MLLRLVKTLKRRSIHSNRVFNSIEVKKTKRKK